MPTPQPPTLRQPRLVQGVRFARSQKRFFEKSSSLGEAFQVNFQRRRWNVFSHPDAVRQVFTAPADVLHAGKGNEILATALGEHSILILDEATAMFDPQGEIEFLEAAREALKGRTVLLITHRPASLAVADRIVLMADGQVVPR